MFDSFLDAFLARKTPGTSFEHKVTFCIKVTFVDKLRKDAHFSFDTDEERIEFIDGYLAKKGKSKKINGVYFENTLIFWRRNSSDDVVPTERPKLTGKGELVLRIRGSNDTVIETDNMNNAARIIDVVANGEVKLCEIQEVAILRRRVAYERRSVLVRLDQLPASSLALDSAD